MRTLIPEFIAYQVQEGNSSGSLQAPVLFLDVSGFTSMTQRLMAHGREGAEIISDIVNRVLDPVVEVVYHRGGFISTFAGDALTAVFPNRAPDNAVTAALEMRRVFDRNHLQRTPYGEFPLESKIGIASGAVQWGIVGRKEWQSYYFRGDAIDGAAGAEQRASPGEILVDREAADELPETCRRSDAGGGYLRITGMDGELPAGEDRRWKAEVSETTQRRFKPLDVLPASYTGEFREVTSVFFAFEDSGEHERIAEAADRMLELAGEYGGYFDVLDFGDKGGVALVLFGSPRSLGQDHERAVGYAAAVLGALGGSVSAGLASGTVFAGYMGSSARATYTALGSTVNLAARIAQSAEPGTAVASEELASKLSQTSYEFTALGSQELKGFDRPVATYRLEQAAARIATAPGELAPIFGRATELERLSDWSARLEEGEHAGLLVVSGEAGVGKSHLLDHALLGAEERLNLFRVTADTILRKSLNPFPRLVTRSFECLGIAAPMRNEERPMRAIEELARRFTEQQGEEEEDDVAELRRSGSALLALLDIFVPDSTYDRLDPQGRFELTLAALTTLVRLMSLQEGVLIVVDDAHAIDSDSVTVLERVLRRTRTLPVGLILSRRNDTGEKTREVEVPDPEDREDIAIGPLPQSALNELLTVELGAPVSNRLVEFIVQRVGANPMYGRELLRYLESNGYLKQTGEGYTVTTEQAPVPSEVSSLLVQRVDTLPGEVKETAQVAAVIGSEFNVHVLAMVLGKTHVNEALRSGEREGLWRQTSDDYYRFEQELIREAIVNMQLERELRDTHGTIVEVLQQVYRHDESHYADLAYHAEAAGLSDRACDFLWNAARYAKDNFKNEKAIEFLTRYLHHAGTNDQRIAAYREMAEIYEVTGDWDRAADSLTYALGLTVISGRIGLRAELLTTLGQIYQRRGMNTEAPRTLELGLKLARHVKNARLTAEALVSLGRTFAFSGDYQAATRHLEEAKQVSREQNDLRHEGLALYYEGVVFRNQNRYTEAMENYRIAEEKFRSLGDRRLVTYPVYDMGVVLQYQGYLDKSRSYFEQALRTYEEIGYKSGASAALLNLGVLRDRRGDFEGAIEYFQQAREIAEAINETLAIAYTLFSIGSTYYKLRDYRKALEYLKDSLKLTHELKAKSYYGYPLSFLVSLYARTGDTDHAIKMCYYHVRNIEDTGSDVENGRGYLGLALALWDHPRYSEKSQTLLEHINRVAGLEEATPESYFRKAIEVSEAASYVNTLIPAHRHYARYLSRQGRQEESRRHLAKSYRLAVSAQWDRFVANLRKQYPRFIARLEAEDGRSGGGSDGQGSSAERTPMPAGK